MADGLQCAFDGIVDCREDVGECVKTEDLK